jgi:hypothetical protein
MFQPRADTMHHACCNILRPRPARALVLGALAMMTVPAPGQDAGAAPGLAWVRFDSSDFSRPRDTGMAEQINVDTGTSFNDYSQLWVGLIELPTDAPVTFSAEADDGLRLLLNRQTVIEGWGLGTQRQGRWQGPNGSRIPMRIEYFQNGGVGHLRLFWEWPGQARELVPATAFRHTPQDAEYVQRLFSGKENATMYDDRSIIFQPEAGIPGRAPDADCPITVATGEPLLLLDDYLIAESRGLRRVVVQPRPDPAIPNPIVTGPEDHCFQPYLSVHRDPQTGASRIWYGAWREDQNAGASCLATMASPDGIHFVRPHRICETPRIQFGSEVLDRGPGHPEPAARYVYSYWFDGGLRLLKSPDGLTWQPLVEGVVLPHNHDIDSISWDPLRQTYVATISVYITGAAWTGQRRTTMMSFSQDLRQWERPWYILTASDRLDEGQTQFYAMEGYLARGRLRIGMVKVLRDDLVATGTEPGSFGRAHTSLAWSWDGRTWTRDRERFFEPDDNPAAWDHAHAWIDEQVPVGDEVYLYYGGYKQGHKMNRFSERQIGLVKMPLDRYVARRATAEVSGTLLTVPLRLPVAPALALRVNANAAGGRLRAQVRDAAGETVVAGFSLMECQPVAADGLQLPLRWQAADLASLAGRTVRFEFEISGADLFAFSVEP